MPEAPGDVRPLAVAEQTDTCKPDCWPNFVSALASGWAEI
ncbi:hypothetical protein APY04_2747 [Hyphomicrobium sulfonivorans]|uniref:Uncharacterized protein n=1 Tax=Hyphomicrobium sulfonivorans TaxID=121290 RepID=A0A109BB36_HYPSL|nr:hypothetical protein APY04_2747 [Hyphomicrobium sulfonivorans]